MSHQTNTREDETTNTNQIGNSVVVTEVDEIVREYEDLKPEFLLQVFRIFTKHLGHEAKACPDCGGSMWTMCEKAMREMYAQGMDKTSDFYRTKLPSYRQSIEKEIVERGVAIAETAREEVKYGMDTAYGDTEHPHPSVIYGKNEAVEQIQSALKSLLVKQ